MTDTPHTRLLVADWDYFFPNPVLLEHCDDFLGWQLHDWSTVEAADHSGDRLGDVASFIWGTRLEQFIRSGRPITMPDPSYRDFWDRFTFADHTQVILCDSNFWAYDFPGAETVRAVDLFDAHHDAHTFPNAYSGETDCGNWMAAYHDDGLTDLNVYYPPWRDTIKGGEADPHFDIARVIDDGRPMPHTYDHVVICRSGAWVPPWCDGAFIEFATHPTITQFPVTILGGDHVTDLRPVSLHHAFEMAATWRMFKAKVDPDVTGPMHAPGLTTAPAPTMLTAEGD